MLRLITILFVLLGVQVRAVVEDTLKDGKILSHLNIHITNHKQQYNHTDSVLVIFDRYDHTGAGWIYKVFYPDKDQKIEIPSVPVGRYYVTVQYLGFHFDRIEKMVRIRKRGKTVRISLQAADEFIAGEDIIPSTRLNLMRLRVWTMR